MRLVATCELLQYSVQCFNLLTVIAVRQVLADATWSRYLNYRRVEYVVYGLSLAHFACNFFIFIPTARHFRRALFDLLLCRRDDSRATCSAAAPSNVANYRRRTTATTGLTTMTPPASRTPSPIVRRPQ